MVHGLRRNIFAVGIGAAVALCGCDRLPGDAPAARRVTARVLDQMRIGRTTPADVEHLLGGPDVQAPDGSLIYRIPRPRRETETLTFRFAGGVLSRICRARS
ncbi:MAG TPA: hypothetical protein VKW76_06970 [Candidatus Binatia bacterium]|nr:hypothetical protein [Candidatus Binatia bacterium]